MKEDPKVAMCPWVYELQWASHHAKGRRPRDEVIRMTLVATIYYLWRERNFTHFHDRKNSPDAMG